MRVKKKIISVVGARPQFIKLAPIARQLPKRFDHAIVHTGQHYDDRMSKLFFRQLELPRVSQNLGIGGCSHAEMTGQMMISLEKLFIKRKPDMVLVYGDTNSTLAGALAAAKLNIPIGHLEAGMRSFVNSMPEEINRKLTDHLSSLLFCPNRASIKQLKNEGVSSGLILAGDLMYEQLYLARTKIKRNLAPLKKHKVEPGSYLYLTIHRAELVSSADKLKALLTILESIDETIILPLHPHTKSSLKRFRLLSRLERMQHVRLCEPQGYFDNLALVSKARVVLTDSGGLQKEALFLGRPVLTLRNETEWIETLSRGNRLVGLDQKLIATGLAKIAKVKNVSHLIQSKRPTQIISTAISKFLES